jgi:hypothetical protein
MPRSPWVTLQAEQRSGELIHAFVDLVAIERRRRILPRERNLAEIGAFAVRQGEALGSLISSLRFCEKEDDDHEQEGDDRDGPTPTAPPSGPVARAGRPSVSLGHRELDPFPCIPDLLELAAARGTRAQVLRQELPLGMGLTFR